MGKWYEGDLENLGLFNFYQIVQKLNPIGGRGHSHPKKIWTEAIHMDCLALGLTETHPSHRKAWSSTLRSAIRMDPYHTRE